MRARIGEAHSTIAGLRYFNVYGPRERHKGKMASMVYQLYRQLKQNGRARLFEGTDGYGNGEQRRDFVFARDVVSVNRFFASRPAPVKGIFNVGTGASRSFNNVARTLTKSLGKGEIEYFPFPESLRGKYQSFTEADVSTLRDAGYVKTSHRSSKASQNRPRAGRARISRRRFSAAREYPHPRVTACARKEQTPPERPETWVTLWTGNR